MARSGGGAYDIAYDDGDEETGVPPAFMKPEATATAPAMPPPPAPGQPTPGDSGYGESFEDFQP